MKKSFCWLFIACFLSITFAGCSSFGKNDADFSISNSDEKQYEDISIEDALVDIREQIAGAVKKELDFFSPQHIAKSREHLRNANELHIEKKDRKEILAKIVLAKKYLTDGYEVKKYLMDHFKEIIEWEEYLDTIGAPDVYPKDYKKILNGIENIVEYVEYGQKDKAINIKEAGDLTASMMDLEIKTTIKVTLEKAYQTLEKAADEGSDEDASNTYLKAKKTVEQAEEYIAKNTRNRDGVELAGQQSLFAANHLLHLGREVRKLGKIKSLEAYLLTIEDYFTKVGKALGSADFRDVPLDDNADSLAVFAGDLAGQVRILNQEAKTLRSSQPKLNEDGKFGLRNNVHK